ncbi:hypothetical protein SNK03_008301 [Fusarium graminearum]|uniref:Chromosome 4, complete genome n=1 Tax=Gibberella zeae (strain ATCC MYA-4620 / CBS 123657 / FGSC 9075 / NRRL 31084 / PH-1) TaxID=229533 RepID=I1RS67_GIBZE|nr:hypothetical protein FGSG_06980 [Fusarium graminearum PH-1]ESU13152.1 hypothetical protein FGSG_06980 [Fusarium graminearum PH-1]EYB23761.1 hypothetical protein FG05_06980 [Fusarium graminearum]CEF83239.1 unnamed protein product [Fusarium graminearum]CZS72745.1 unnamed protein product [Fusarium graminearum]|eukprot:XP_011326659.1 hypothetical protein FGSG_06980 [Fusarium graminearum PH-1]
MWDKSVVYHQAVPWVAHEASTNKQQSSNQGFQFVQLVFKANQELRLTVVYYHPALGNKRACMHPSQDSGILFCSVLKSPGNLVTREFFSPTTPTRPGVGHGGLTFASVNVQDNL